MKDEKIRKEMDGFFDYIKKYPWERMFVFEAQYEAILECYEAWKEKHDGERSVNMPKV